jgi:general secretion pathway protein M
VNWVRSHRRSAWIIGLTILVPALLYLNALSGLLSLRQEYQSGIDALSPRIARLQGLIDHEVQLREAAGEVDQQVLGLVYPASEDRATVSARLQKEVRQMLVDAGLSVSNSQVMPLREKDFFDYVGVKITVTGDVAGLNAALTSLSLFQPLVLVESLDVWPKRESRRRSGATESSEGRQVVNATMQLLSLRAVQ